MFVSVFFCVFPAALKVRMVLSQSAGLKQTKSGCYAAVLLHINAKCVFFFLSIETIPALPGVASAGPSPSFCFSPKPPSRKMATSARLEVQWQIKLVGESTSEAFSWLNSPFCVCLPRELPHGLQDCAHREPLGTRNTHQSRIPWGNLLRSIMQIWKLCPGLVKMHCLAAWAIYVPFCLSGWEIVGLFSFPLIDIARVKAPECTHGKKKKMKWPQESINPVSREHKIPIIALSKQLQLIPFLFHFNASWLPLTHHQRRTSVYQSRGRAKL